MPSSGSRDTKRVLRTIADNIGFARRFVADLTLETFASDLRAQYAVTRCLEIISEASRRLPDDVKARYPEVPWQRIAGAGNVYRHDYEDVLPGILWVTLSHHLDSLDGAVRREMGEGQV